MYIMGGGGRCCRNEKVFIRKLYLKQGFFVDTNLDYLTSEWSETSTRRYENPNEANCNYTKNQSLTTISEIVNRMKRSIFFIPELLSSEAKGGGGKKVFDLCKFIFSD